MNSIYAIDLPLTHHQSADNRSGRSDPVSRFLNLITLAEPYVHTLSKLEEIAESGASFDLLIVGEQGLHQEWFARHVHQLLHKQHRRIGDFVKLGPNITTSQLEEELLNSSSGDLTDGKLRPQGLLLNLATGKSVLRGRGPTSAECSTSTVNTLSRTRISSLR